MINVFLLINAKKQTNLEGFPMSSQILSPTICEDIMQSSTNLVKLCKTSSANDTHLKRDSHRAPLTCHHFLSSKDTNTTLSLISPKRSLIELKPSPIPVICSFISLISLPMPANCSSLRS